MRGAGVKILRACPSCGKELCHVSNGRAPYCDKCRREKRRESLKKWQASPQGKYKNQMDMAITRGIEWKFTFETWMAWWGDDLAKRGTHADELCMARFGDEGPYSPDNVYKTTNTENTREQLRIRYAA